MIADGETRAASLNRSSENKLKQAPELWVTANQRLGTIALLIDRVNDPNDSLRESLDRGTQILRRVALESLRNRRSFAPNVRKVIAFCIFVSRLHQRTSPGWNTIRLADYATVLALSKSPEL